MQHWQPSASAIFALAITITPCSSLSLYSKPRLYFMTEKCLCEGCSKRDCLAGTPACWHAALTCLEFGGHAEMHSGSQDSQSFAEFLRYLQRACLLRSLTWFSKGFSCCSFEPMALLAASCCSFRSFTCTSSPDLLRLLTNSPLLHQRSACPESFSAASSENGGRAHPTGIEKLCE